jgi:hypothetical protein
MNKTKFINNVVLGWIKSDLIRMRDTIRPDKSEVGNINFPLALCTLSCAEYLGGFLLGEDKKFTGNVDKYINECFKNPDEYPIEILRDLIRNGLAHDYFPRGAISRNNKRPSIYRGRSYSIVLDAETLVNDFIDSLDVFIEKLENIKFETRMQELHTKIDEFQAKYKSYIENLGGQPDDDEQATPSSGPSGYPKSVNTTTIDPNIE